MYATSGRDGIMKPLYSKNFMVYPGAPMVFTAYKDEQVVLDGSEVINARMVRSPGKYLQSQD